MNTISGVEQTIGYTFKSNYVLQLAMTHVSYARQHRLQGNEDLECLGDSVLGMLVTNSLYFSLHHAHGMSTRKQALCSNANLARLARRINLQDYVLLATSESRPVRDSILADAFEALIAAIYLDGGINAARHFVERFVLEVK